MQKYIEYQKSISKELIAIKDRVRHFIGSANWNEEGRYKESILIDSLKKVLPTHVGVGTGFIIDENGSITKQIDIIVYDSRIPLLFRKDAFVITTKECVYGIIEVKTKLDNTSFITTIDNSLHNGIIVNEESRKNIFNAIFCYESNVTYSQTLKMKLLSTNGVVNHISLGENKFLRFWEKGNPASTYLRNHYGVYEIIELSFGYFISNLVAHVYEKDNKNSTENDELYNYLFPIEGTKEVHRLYSWEVTER